MSDWKKLFTNLVKVPVKEIYGIEYKVDLWMMKVKWVFAHFIAQL